MFIATDLDRTLLPNGIQPYDGSMSLFKRIIKKEKLGLIYVTGRNLREVKRAFKEYGAPRPDYLIAEGGTKIYFDKRKRLVEDKQWLRKIGSAAKDWNIRVFKKIILDIEGVRIQERIRQNQFKLGYYLSTLKASDKLVKKVRQKIKKVCPSAVIIFSIDETQQIGLLDIIPRSGTKLAGLEYLRKKLGLRKKDIIYCGDSGNDILPLTFGYQGILVRNAITQVKKIVREKAKKRNIAGRIYIAKGRKPLNGYYVSGIIEGLIKKKVISFNYLDLIRR